MKDVLSAYERSALMARVRQSSTAPELKVRKGLWKAGFRYKLNDKGLPGKPDVVLPRWRAAIFVHGCFWHGHETCRASRLPSTRREFWETKIRQNSLRDRLAIERLKADGWRTAIVWECAVKKDPAGTVAYLDDWLRSSKGDIEIWRSGAAVEAGAIRSQSLM